MLLYSYALEDKDKGDKEEERMTTTTSFLSGGNFGVGPEDYSLLNDASAGGETVGEFPKFASPSDVNDDVNVNEDDDETNLMLLASREIERLREENAEIKRSAREIASKCARNLEEMRERLTRITQRDKRGARGREDANANADGKDGIEMRGVTRRGEETRAGKCVGEATYRNKTRRYCER